jgi:hypothetical protein
VEIYPRVNLPCPHGGNSSLWGCSTFAGGIPREAEAVFIQVMQGRALDPPGIRQELNRWQRQLATDADGWLGATAGVTEDGWSVVVMYFDSERQARRSSDRPEHRAWWREASQHLGEVAFHDAPQVRLFGDGRSDLAGYVQVIQGHIDDLERMASLGGDQEEVLAREAPHILGVTVAEHADRPGDFTQILYFTSEQDARRFEVEPLTDADESAQEERRGLMTDLRSFDLREPQLLVPPVVVTY